MYGNGLPMISSLIRGLLPILIRNTRNLGSVPTKSCAAAAGLLLLCSFATPGETFTLPTGVTFGPASEPAPDSSSRENTTHYSGAITAEQWQQNNRGTLVANFAWPGTQSRNRPALCGRVLRFVDRAPRLA